MSNASMTFAEMTKSGMRVAYWCAWPGCHGGHFHLSGPEGAERFGADATIEDVRRRLRCKWCGHRGKKIIPDVWTPGPPRSF